jgi:hypothetical protein
MMVFNGRERPLSGDRFGRLPGAEAWERLLREARDDPFRAFDDFLRDIRQTDPELKKACVFISHRQADWERAEDVAKIIEGEGFNCWLDIHDPLLQWATPLAASPGGAVLIAAIIEIALLNSTHVIALHTSESRGSKWIPYELGRAKARSIFSKQAAGWFEDKDLLKTCGEYVYLAVQTFSDDHIRHWLKHSPQSGKIGAKGGLFAKPSWQ